MGDGYSTIEGVIRQSTQNPEEYRLTMLLDRKEIIGRELVTYTDLRI